MPSVLTYVAAVRTHHAGRSWSWLLGLPLFCCAATTQAAGLSGEDLAALLYSNQFSFSPDGVPLVNIGLMQTKERVQFMAPGGLVFRSTTEGGTTIRTPRERTWTARVEEGRPATIRYWAIVDQLRGQALTHVTEALDLWRGRGWSDVTSFELGAVFGFRGEVFDNRFTIIAVGGRDTAAAAEQVARELYGTYKVPIALHEEMIRLPEGRIVVEDQKNELRIESHRVLMAIPVDHQPFRVFRIEEGTGTRWHTYRDRSYRGALYLAVDREGRLTVGNQVDAEQLLAGLVPAEIFPDSPMEALKAQAVAARGILLSKLGTRHLADPFLLCSQVHCQVYSGVEREHRRTTEAVAATRGELLFSGQGLTDTVYHACSGGHTADNETVWTDLPDPGLRGRPDTESNQPLVAGPSEAQTRAFLLSPPKDAFAARTAYGRTHFRWKTELSAARVTELVAARHPGLGGIRELNVLERASCGRIRRLEVVGAQGRVTVHRELPIRQLLGGLKSGLFVIDVVRDPQGRPATFVFIGGGFGHGVGMCQVGTIGRAEAGQNYRTILGHYYNGAQVKQVY